MIGRHYRKLVRYMHEDGVAGVPQDRWSQVSHPVVGVRRYTISMWCKNMVGRIHGQLIIRAVENGWYWEWSRIYLRVK